MPWENAFIFLVFIEVPMQTSPRPNWHLDFSKNYRKWPNLPKTTNEKQKISHKSISQILGKIFFVIISEKRLVPKLELSINLFSLSNILNSESSHYKTINHICLNKYGGEIMRCIEWKKEIFRSICGMILMKTFICFFSLWVELRVSIRDINLVGEFEI